MKSANREWCPGGKSPRLHGTFITIRKGSGGVTLSIELDRKMGHPVWVALNKRNANALEMVKADKDHPNALYVTRYKTKGRISMVKIGDIGTKRWLLDRGYVEGQRIGMFEINPGVWAENT